MKSDMNLLRAAKPSLLEKRNPKPQKELALQSKCLSKQRLNFKVETKITR